MILKAFASLLLSNQCIGCEKTLQLNNGQVAICEDCFRGLSFLRSPANCPHLPKRYFDQAFSCLAYEGIVLDWVHQFKYHRQLYLGKQLAKLLVAMDWGWFPFDFLVPVPLYWFRHFRKGFNPSHLLAHELAKGWKKPILPCLKKQRATPGQAELSRAERLENVQGSFTLLAKTKAVIKDKTLLLIDDVLTTGATVNECAKVLKKSGAAQVIVLTLARTL